MVLLAARALAPSPAWAQGPRPGERPTPAAAADDTDTDDTDTGDTDTGDTDTDDTDTGDTDTGDAVTEEDVAPALTEEERSERARALFAEGVGHSQAEAWADAAASFEAALELRTAAPIRYNLAAAYVELGRYREAREQLDAVDSDPETQPNIAALSSELAERIRREAGRLSVERPPRLGEASLTLDAEPLDEIWLGREIPVRPGAHVVAAAQDGREVARAEVSVAAGDHTHVVLGLTNVEDPGAGDGNGNGDENGGASTPFYEDWIFWAAVGGGAVVLIIVIVAIAAAASGGSAAPVPGNFMPGVITW